MMGELDLQKSLLAGDDSVFEPLFTLHRPRLWQMVQFRLSEQIRGRVDPDDVVQEIYLDATKRLRSFQEGGFPSFFLWLRLVAYQTLRDLHRKHLGAESRSAFRESQPFGGGAGESTSQSLSRYFVSHFTSPSQAASRGEAIAEVRAALESMSQIDREVLALRHFEELTNQEVAIELGIAPKAASIRYVRALERLRKFLEKASSNE